MQAPAIRASLHPRAKHAWTPLARALSATGDQWTLMIALQLAPGRMRLTRLHDGLPGVSAGVLSRYLQQMIALGLVTRTRFSEVPPRVELELTQAGRELVPIAGALARWGFERMWSTPVDGERIDVEVVLRMLPTLLGERVDLPSGAVQIVIARAEEPITLVLRIKAGRVLMEDRTGARKRDDTITARIRGDADGWTAALGPACDYRELRFSGDRWFARLLLDSLAGRE